MLLRRAGRLACLVTLVAMSAGCAASLREHVTPFPARTPRTVPWTLNRELLMPVDRRILFVVDLAQGHPPERAALDVLVHLAARYGERPAAWVILGSAGAPPLRSDGDRITATGPLDADTSYVLVRYVGAQIGNWGLSYTTRVAGRAVYVILVNQERHRRWSWFLPERHLEAQTLVHEYGHLLGLPPFDHGYYPRYPDFSDGAHCVNPDCALSKPRWRALVYGLGHTFLGGHYLEDYCAACRAAIAAAKRYWRAATPPAAGSNAVSSSPSAVRSRAAS
jgi:hypothetical protein